MIYDLISTEVSLPELGGSTDEVHPPPSKSGKSPATARRRQRIPDACTQKIRSGGPENGGPCLDN